MPKHPMTRERQTWIHYLYRRAYPISANGTRRGGAKEFYAELCDQPDNVLLALYDSAKQEEENRKKSRLKEKAL